MDSIGSKYNKETGKFAIGLGRAATRTGAEQCLLGTRGHPKRMSAAVRQVIIARTRGRSRKPDEMLEPCSFIPVPISIRLQLQQAVALTRSLGSLSLVATESACDLDHRTRLA